MAVFFIMTIIMLMVMIVLVVFRCNSVILAHFYMLVPQMRKLRCSLRAKRAHVIDATAAETSPGKNCGE